MSWTRRIALALTLAGGAGALAYAFRPRPLPVEVVTARKTDFVLALEEDGVTRVREPHVVSAPMGGRIDRILLHAGDAVAQGAVLATLRPADAPLLDAAARRELAARLASAEFAAVQARAASDRARALGEHAKLELDRVRRLAASGSVAPALLDRAELDALGADKETASAAAGVRIAAQGVDIARTALERSAGSHAGDEWVLRAATDGTILRVLRESEGVVAPGAPLLELGDLSALEVVLDVLSSDAVRIPRGAEVMLSRWGGPEDLRGRVTRVGSAARTKVSSLGVEEQRVDVTVELLSPREKWMALGDGFRVRGRIALEKRPGAITVPTSALFRRAEGWGVFVVTGGRVTERAVTLGRSNGRDAALEAGLAEGDQVVRHPSDQLTEGARVAPSVVTVQELPAG